MIRERVLWVLLVCAVIFAAWHYVAPAPLEIFATAPVAVEVKDVKKEDVPVKKIRSYPPATKKKVGMSSVEQQADNIYLVSAAKLAPDPRPRTVTAVYDSVTGEVHQDVRIDPLPWLATESHGTLWIGMGVKNSGKQVGRVEANYDVLQVKSFHLGIRANVDTDKAWFVGFGVMHPL